MTAKPPDLRQGSSLGSDRSYVGASLELMERDARRMRGARPFLYSNLRKRQAVAEIADFIEKKGGLSASS